tara:strand:+ start:522 stop:1445 length:924 start_codon:yes stop_codon:yes gene_type:complete
MAWERLAHVELSGSSSELNSGTFTAKKNLKVIAWFDGDGTTDPFLTFNDVETGSAYAARYSKNGGSDSTNTSLNNGIRLLDGGTTNPMYMECTITNISDEEKLVVGHTIEQGSSGAGNAPQRQEFVGKWTNTSSQITSIQLDRASNNFESGSYITVLGAKEAATANVMTVDGFTAKKHLMIQAKVIGGNGNTFTFNNDTGNNYTHRYQNNGGSDGTQTSRANLWSYYDSNDTTKFTTLYVLNEASKEKLVITENVSAVGTGAGTAPTRTESVGKWVNTSNQITRVDVGTFTTDGLEEGSEVTVYGTD